MKLNIILAISIIAILTSQNLYSQEKVDTTAMKERKSIHQLEWEKHKEQSERNLQLEYTLLQMHPNPFNLEKTFEYHIPVASEVRMEIYTIGGVKIRTLVKGQTAAGKHQIIWDSTNDDNKTVANGIYVLKLYVKPENSSTNFQKTRKILVIKYK